MAFVLSEQARAAGFRLESFDTVGSTNTEALALGRAGEPGPVWVVARRQSAGRGRRGNAWSTDEGDLAASLLLTLNLPTATIANLGFVAGVALVKALCLLRDAPLRIAEGRRPVSKQAATFALKWPNDVLVDGAKLAGILLETERLRDGRHAVVVGLGVNVSTQPDGPTYPVVSLRALGVETDAGTLFAHLSSTWVETAGIWAEGKGFAEIRRLWLDHAVGVGGEVRVRLPRREILGTFETIDEAGRLIMRVPDGGLTAISAGEVYFPHLAAA